MIYLGSDHGGFALKEHVKTWLKEWGYEFDDKGPEKLEPEDDFPDYAFPVADAVGVSDDPNLPWKDRDKGILICRSSGGMVIAANKVLGVRAVAAFDEKGAAHARSNDDANVLGLSGDWVTDETAKTVVKAFLETEFSRQERHQRRLAKIIYREMQMGGCGGGGCGNGGCCGGGGCGNC